jgi:hypothetical protein
VNPESWQLKEGQTLKANFTYLLMFGHSWRAAKFAFSTLHHHYDHLDPNVFGGVNQLDSLRFLTLNANFLGILLERGETFRKH